MKKIPLTKGQFALVDDDEFESLSRYRWCALKNKWGFYAVRGGSRNGKPYFVLMHRQIMQTPDGTTTDHINHNGLDNRRSNLRVCSIAENNANSRIARSNHSGFKGVGWHKAAKKWKAAISINNVSKHLGLFDNPILAAAAYDSAAVHFRGQFACTNRSLGVLP